MSSNIDISKPTDKSSSTKVIRDNFAITKTEIEALQTNKVGGLITSDNKLKWLTNPDNTISTKEMSRTAYILEKNNVVGNGTSDDSVALQAALLEMSIKFQKSRFTIPYEIRKILIDKPINIYCDLLSCDFNHIELIAGPNNIPATLTIEGSISGTTLTVVSDPSSPITIGTELTSGAAIGTRVIDFITGLGGIGTYRITGSQNVTTTVFDAIKNKSLIQISNATYVGTQPKRYMYGTLSNSISNFILVGLDDETKLLDGIDISNTSPIVLRNVGITGFYNNLTLGNDFYISGFDNLISINSKNAGVLYYGSSNTGESIKFFGGSISDSKNTARTAVGLLVPATAGGPDLVFFNTSMSYSNISADIQCGVVSLFHPHLENNNNNPHIKVSYTGGKPATILNISGGGIGSGPLTPSGEVYEVAGGRQSLIEIPSTSGDRLTVNINGTKFGLYGKKNTEIVRYTGGGRPNIKINGILIDQQGDNLPKICQRTSLIYNGGFEVSAQAGWLTVIPASDVTVTQDTAVFNSGTESNGGTKSLKIVSNNQSFSYKQNVSNIEPGSCFSVRGYVQVPIISTGTIFVKISFLLSDQVTIISSTITKQITTVLSNFTQFGQVYFSPAGTSYVQIELLGTGFTGTCYFDDLDIWAL